MTSDNIYQSDKSLKFIEKAKLVHGDRYDYPLVEYVNAHSKVKIGCRIHGTFEQSPDNHLHNHGCGKCAASNNPYSRPSDASEFISKANIVHDFYYGYSLVEYINSKTKVKIICNEHGIFEQTPGNHLHGQRCPSCAKLDAFKSLDQFIAEANAVYNFKFDYSETEYIGGSSPIKVICEIHGSFNQLANAHLNGVGCKKCSRTGTKTTEQFISDARMAHGLKFNYSISIYIGAHDKIKIECPIHGVFEQTPASHVYGRGCPKCKHNESKIATKWLDSLHIESLIREYDIPEYPTRKPVDGYDPLTNTVYQFHGDFWHGNLNNPRCKPDSINSKNKKTFGELNRLTNESDDWIRSQGYNLIVMWEMVFLDHLARSKIRDMDCKTVLPVT